MNFKQFLGLLSVVAVFSAFIWGLIFATLQSNVFSWLLVNWEVWTITGIIGLFLFAYILRRYGYDID